MVLAKLGNDDSDSDDAASDNEVTGVSSGPPKRSHVAPRVAFPLLKCRTKGKAQVMHPFPTIVPTSEQSPVPESLVPSVSAVPEQSVRAEIASTAPRFGVADVLADIRKSLASLSAPSTVPGVSRPLMSVISTSTALSLVSPAPQVTAPVTQANDPTAQALVEISRLLATIGGGALCLQPPGIRMILCKNQ
ncbi:hypothetical protein NDU88_004091 [Pleurodeles waltl]|uniref:Uncharacterized protein n=1 Tax=Pleurodeles waltl TaxID=8319 RepID=A0AAV7QBK4_PLEWA|nr:hypothetical protein NDU88_004091 [Pleurodeles waltl]